MNIVIVGVIGLLLGAGGVYVLIVNKLKHQLNGAQRKLERADQAGSDAIALDQELQAAQAALQAEQTRRRELEASYQQQLAQVQTTHDSSSETTEEVTALSEQLQHLQALTQNQQTQIERLEAEKLALENSYQDRINQLQTSLDQALAQSSDASAELSALTSEVSQLRQQLVDQDQSHQAQIAQLHQEKADVEATYQAQLSAPALATEPESTNSAINLAGAAVAGAAIGIVAEQLLSSESADAPPVESDAPDQGEENWVDASPELAEQPPSDLAFKPWQDAALDIPADLVAPDDALLSLEEPDQEEENWVDSPLDLDDNALDIPADFLAEIPTDNPEALLEEMVTPSDDVLDFSPDFLAEIPTDNPEALLEEMVTPSDDALDFSTDFLAEIPATLSEEENLTDELSVIPTYGSETVEDLDEQGSEMDFLLELQQQDLSATQGDELFADLGAEAGLDMPELPLSEPGDESFINFLDTSVDSTDNEFLELLDTGNRDLEEPSLGDNFFEGLGDMFAEEDASPATNIDFGDLDELFGNNSFDESMNDATESLEEMLAHDPLTSTDWDLPSEPKTSDSPFE